MDTREFASSRSGEFAAPASAKPASFAERLNALPTAAPPQDSFSPVLGYAASTALTRASAFPFELRGGFEPPTGTSGARAERRERPAPPLPTTRSAYAEESTRGIDLPTRGIDMSANRRGGELRVASLDPTATLPAGGTVGAPRAKPNDIPTLVTAMAEKHGVPVPLAHAVVRVESNYKPHLIGRGATYGLMQIKYPTARGMGFEGKPNDLFDPATNLEWGMRYLAGARRIAKGNLCGTVLRYQGGHYSVRMTQAASVYCGKVRRYMAASGSPPQTVAAALR